MIYSAIVLFALAAVLGLTILISWLSKKNASRAVIYSHGIVAAAALVLLIIYASRNPEHFPKASIVLFVTAALGGFYMFFADLRKNKRPVAVAFIHGLLAVAGFVMLLAFVFM